MISDLQSFVSVLEKEGQLVRVKVPVSPHLEAAEIHRRVIAEEGPAILFERVDGSDFPLVTNLFGNEKRINLAFGADPIRTISGIAALAHEAMPPTFKSLWANRGLLARLTRVGARLSKFDSISFRSVEPALDRLPLLTTWKEDGGPFITLPLVYTRHPETGIPNLGMYRMQRYDSSSTGMHFQIAKGGGYHLAAARELSQALPVNVHVGGPPALILAAIAPLPENVPEVMLASLLMGQKLRMGKDSSSSLPYMSSAEFVLLGEVAPDELKPEGPFGDHYGYYSLRHDYPVFRCRRMLHRPNAIFAATVVGKPKQEDFYLGDYLQKLLSPLFPLVMPSVRDLWSYGETGYHSLAAAVVKQRFKREAMVAAFRILGEGQLALTKFLIVLDKHMDLADFRSVLAHVLERCDFRTDLYVFSNLSMDTLDYTGPSVNRGSKGVILGSGDPIRHLPGEFTGTLAPGFDKAIAFCPGCLVVQGPSCLAEPSAAKRLAQLSSLSEWPLIALVDDADATIESQSKFLWTVFTRFDPALDMHASKSTIESNHIAFSPPIVIDARMKPTYPAELECDPETAALVDRRWSEYGIS